MTPRPTVAQLAASLRGTHVWGRWVAGQDADACLLCGVVRRADDGNRPCKGVVRVVTRGVGS